MSLSSYATVQCGDSRDFADRSSGSLVGSTFVLGMVIIGASLVIGNPYAVSGIACFVAFCATIFLRKHQRAWIYLASVLAATPVNSPAVASCNLLFAFWLIVFDPGYLSKLPKWLYLPSLLGVLAFVCSSINWASHNVTPGILQQTAYMFNYLMAPFILLPTIYFRMARERDSLANLKGLLMFLIVPSLLMLVAAHLLGRPIQFYFEGFRNAMDMRLYQFINTQVNFTRTHVGFIIASLICASTAITLLKVKTRYRVAAAMCLALSFLLLLVTASVGSAIACFCGITAILYIVARRIQVMRSFVAIIVLACLLLLVWGLSPDKVHNYVEQRYQERFVGKRINAEDRWELWSSAINYIEKHPEGVGWSLSYGDTGLKRNPHNDYFLYAINYGVVGGLVYAYVIVRLLIYFLRKSKAKVKDPSAQAINLIGLGVIVVLLVNSMSDHLVADKWYFNVIWSILWYTYFCSRAEPKGVSGIRPGFGVEARDKASGRQVELVG